MRGEADVPQRKRCVRMPQDRRTLRGRHRGGLRRQRRREEGRRRPRRIRRRCRWWQEEGVREPGFGVWHLQPKARKRKRKDKVRVSEGRLWEWRWERMARGRRVREK